MTTILDIPGSNPPNPFSAPLETFLSSTTISSAPATEKTAAQIVATVNSSSDPAHALWQLWDALFTAVATFLTSHTPLLALLEALRTQPPTQPINVSGGSHAERKLRSYIKADGKLPWASLPLFNAQWRDVHDILQAWRDWDGVRTSGAGDNSSTTSALSSSGAQYYLCFCTFSAALLRSTKGNGFGCSMQVFFACHDVLEREGPQPRQHPKAHRMTPEQVWALDVRVAATWMRDGGRVLWGMRNQEELRRHWAAALDEKTGLWPREDGLTRERWQLWGVRLRALATEEEKLDDETRAVVTEAATVVEGILRENST